jgi:hypothetical protein
LTGAKREDGTGAEEQIRTAAAVGERFMPQLIGRGLDGDSSPGEDGSVAPRRRLSMDFEWDDTKAEANERKHGVSFTDDLTVFADPLSLTGYDPDSLRWACPRPADR